jgi:hypothetical protein
MDVEDGNGTDCIAAKSHKLFKMPVPNELFYGFIQKITHKIITNVSYFLIDISAYKKAIYCDEFQPMSLLQQFCNDLMLYYCKNKQFFITRKMSYNNFNTILRHICRHNGIDFKSERKYDKSKTQIVYYIYCIA